MSALEDNKDRKTRAEDGFALYLAVGFIVLISVLAGSVGTKLNIAALSEARKNDRRAALDEAEAGLAHGLLESASGIAANALWSGSAVAASDAFIDDDREKCIRPFESISEASAYYPSDRANNGERARRFFVKRDGNDVKIYGCGFDDKGTRIAFGLYAASGNTLSLTRLRRY